MSQNLDLDALKQDLDQFFLLVMGMIVFLMQCGFAFLEAGCVRSKNTSNILIKNLLDSFVAGLSYYLVGYALAFGDGNSFIGWNNWALSNLDDNMLATFFFQFVFAATAATIVSGALAERCEFVAYFVYSSCITMFVYPVVTRWAWHDDGWLKAGDKYDLTRPNEVVGYQDFAGSGVVHCVGGTAAFIGALLMGPRIGRFGRKNIITGRTQSLKGHSVPFAALGGFILIFGFMAFNGGSQLAISNPGDGTVVSLAIVNTVISGSVAAFVTLIVQKFKKDEYGRHIWSLLTTLNGALAGMVAACAGCNAVRPWGAACIGLIAAVFYIGVSELMVKLKVDDPLDAVAVHFGGGSWGVISVALLKYEYDGDSNGLLMEWDRKAGLMLAWQLCGLVTIVAWTAVLSVLIFGVLKVLGKLRVPEEMEEKGLDIPKHGEPAYPLEAYGHGHWEKLANQDEDIVEANVGNGKTALSDDDLDDHRRGTIYVIEGALVDSDTARRNCPDINEKFPKAKAKGKGGMNAIVEESESNGHDNSQYVGDELDNTKL